MKKTLTVYLVHADTDNGAWIEHFTDPAKEKEFCEKLMREQGGDEVNKLLDAGENDEAWCEFQQETTCDQDYYFRHEIEVELPTE